MTCDPESSNVCFDDPIYHVELKLRVNYCFHFPWYFEPKRNFKTDNNKKNFCSNYVASVQRKQMRHSINRLHIKSIKIAVTSPYMMLCRVPIKFAYQEKKKLVHLIILVSDGCVYWCGWCIVSCVRPFRLRTVHPITIKNPFPFKYLT